MLDFFWFTGKVSLANHLIWLEPYSDEDTELTETAREFMSGRYSHAVYSKEGGWPLIVEETVARVSKEQGFSESRLPAFTPEEIELVKGTYDFYGMNHYTTKLVRPRRPDEEVTKSIATCVPDIDAVLDTDPSWTFGHSPLFAIYPEGMTAQMAWLREKYGDIEILITENGTSVSLSLGDSNKFPPWFQFGAATAAFQVEGAWNVSDKGESKWDRLIHRYSEKVGDGSNGDDACKSYYLWERDVEMAAELGLQFYRFSISWPRLLPTGFANNISDDGKNYYNNLIDGLLQQGIEPVVTMYHWDLPQTLQDLGGWSNPKISDWFAEYARVVYSLYADRVKTWITINEAVVECDWYYGPGVLFPTLDFYVGPYMCTKNVLLGHAKAYRIYDEEFKPNYNGKVSLANHLLWLEPYSDEDKELTETAREFLTGRFSHPIYSKEGGWPPIVEETVARVSKEQGFSESRLPAFTQQEIELIRGTYDFYGMNHYTTKLVRPRRPNEEVVYSLYTYIPDISAVLDSDPDWTYGYSPNNAIYPEGMRAQMAWLKEKYGDIEILITENGYSTLGSNLTDDGRISFIDGYLEQVLVSIDQGINVTGYTYWTIMDNFEWLDGYVTKFGIYEVDFSDVNRTRTPRKSAIHYSDIIKNRSLNNL